MQSYLEHRTSMQRQSEVGHERIAPIVEQDVPWFDIAMH
jgi:hypothetical protein